MPRPDVALKPAPPSPAPARGQARGANRVLQAAAIVIVALLVWRLADVLLLAFGAVLIGVLLHALATPLTQGLRLPRSLALSLAVGGLTAVLGGAIWLFGQQTAVQAVTLGELVPRAWQALEARLATSAFGAYILDDLQRLRHADGLVVQTASRLVQSSLSAAGRISGRSAWPTT